MGFYDEVFGSGNIDKPSTVYTDNHTSISEAYKRAAGDIVRQLTSIGGGYSGTLSSLGDPDKYADVGLQVGRNLKRAQDEGKLNDLLAESQSGWQQARHAVAQTLVNELALGTAKAYSDVFDFFIGGALRLATGEDNDYTNPVSQLLEEAQESFRNYVPIYSKEDASLTNPDFGWWMSNIPSIVSSLTLMAPAKTMSAGISKLNKVIKSTNLGRKGGITTRRFLSNALGRRRYDKLGELAQYGAEGVLMRIGENYQEARQTYNEMLPEAQESINKMDNQQYADFVKTHAQFLGNDVDYNDRNKVAERIATMSADETFKDDMGNAVFDAWQLWGIAKANRFIKAPTRGKLERLHKLQMKFPDKSIEELKEILKNRSTKQKIWDSTKDLAKGVGFITMEESSEGVEEAVNYISQQEGLKYGHALLARNLSDKDKESLEYNKVPFNRTDLKALEEYGREPELWDSAFWGVIGGVVFGSGASKVENLRNKYAVRSRAKQLKKEGNSDEFIENWIKEQENPEYTRREANLANRHYKYEQYKQRMKLIEEGKNPFNKNESIDKNNAQEVELYKQRVLEDFDTSIMLNALDAGHWDLSKAFLQSDELTKQLVDAGFISQEDANNRKEQLNNRIKEIETMYNRSMDAIDNAITQFSDDKVDLTDMPSEYFDIIARENIYHRIAAKRLQEDIDKIKSENERILSDDITRQKIEESGYNAESLIRNAVQGKVLGELIAEKKALLESEESATLSGQALLNEYNNKIYYLHREIANNFTTYKDDALYLRTIQSAYSTRKEKSNEEGVPDKYVIDEEFYKKVDNAIANNDIETLKSLNIAYDSFFDGINLDVVKDQIKLIDEAYNHIYNDNKNRTVTNIKDISEKLHENYHMLPVKEMQLYTEKSSIVSTKSEILATIDRYNNQMQGVANDGKGRSLFLELGLRQLQEMSQKYSDKYGKYAIDDLVDATLNGEEKPAIWEALDADEKKTFNDIMHYANLTANVNTNLRDRFHRALRLADIVDFTKENSITNQNPPQSTQNTEQANTPQTAQNSVTNQISGQIDSQSQQQLIQQTPIQQPQPETKPANVVIADNKIAVDYRTDDNVDDDTINIIDHGNGLLELDLVNSTNKPANLIRNTDLFDGVTDGELEVTRNPLVRIGENGAFEVEMTGDVVSKNDNATKPSSTQTSEQQILSTGEEMESEYVSSDDEFDDDETLAQKINRYIADYISNNTDYNYIDVAKYVKEQLSEIPEEDLDEYLYTAISWNAFVLSDTGRPITEATEEEIKEALGNTVMFSRLIDTEVGVMAREQISKILDDAVNKIVDAYIRQYALDKVNGKYLLSKEGLLAFYDSLAKDVPIRDIYDAVINRIEYSSKYVVIDSEESKEDIINDITSPVTKENRKKEYLERFSNSTSVAISRYLNMLASAKKDTDLRYYLGYNTEEEVNDAISIVREQIKNAKVGDKLTYNKQEGINQRGVNIFLNSVKIGEIPLPIRSSDFNVWTMKNRGWNTDVPTNAYNLTKDINSAFGNFVKHLILPTNKKEKQLKKALDDVIAANEKNKEKAASNFIKLIRKDNSLNQLLTDAGPKADLSRTNHIIDLLNYTIVAAQLDGITNATDYTSKRLDSVDDWIRKLSNSYEQAELLYDNSNLDVSISKASISNPIITSDFHPITAAIGEKTNVKLGIVTRGNSANITLSDGTTVSNREHNKINTPVIVITEGAQQAIIYLKSRILGNNTSDVGKQLKEAIRKEFSKVINEWKNDKENDGSNIKNFFYKLTHPKYSANAAPLFRGGYITNTKNGFAINVKFGDTEQVLYFTNNHKIIFNKRQISVANATKLLDNLQFNISEKLLTASIDTELDGFAKYNKSDTDTPFHITIGDITIKAKSFADFIMDNDFIDVKTNQEKKSNFTEPKHLDITYRIAKPEVVPTAPIRENASQFVNDKVKSEIDKVLKDTSIINSKNAITFNNDNNLSHDILKILLKGLKTLDGKYLLNILNNSSILGNFLHKNVTFVPNFNDLYLKDKEGNFVKINDAKAAYVKSKTTLYNENGEVSVIIPKGSIIIGQSWMNLAIGTLADREKAARHLLHENVHAVLQESGKEKWEPQITSIYNEVLDAIKNDTTLTDEDKTVLEYYTKPGKDTLEEFLVESITRPELMTVLNKIKVSEPLNNKVSKKKSLLQKILDLIAKMFNIDVKDDTLLRKEYNLFSDIVEQVKKERTKTKQEKNKFQQLDLFENNKQIVEEQNSEQTNVVDEQTETNETTKKTSNAEDISEIEEKQKEVKDKHDTIINEDVEQINEDDEDLLGFSIKDDILFASKDAMISNLNSETQIWFDNITNNGLLTLTCK